MHTEYPRLWSKPWLVSSARKSMGDGEWYAAQLAELQSVTESSTSPKSFPSTTVATVTLEYLHYMIRHRAIQYFGLKLIFMFSC